MKYHPTNHDRNRPEYAYPEIVRVIIPFSSLSPRMVIIGGKLDETHTATIDMFYQSGNPSKYKTWIRWLALNDSFIYSEHESDYEIVLEWRLIEEE